jgi:hypothetical protein
MSISDYLVPNNYKWYSNSATTTMTTPTFVPVSGTLKVTAPPPAPPPEDDLAWLHRRVDEIVAASGC